MTNDAQWPIYLPLSDHYREEIINYMQDEEHPDGPDDRCHYVRADLLEAERARAAKMEAERDELRNLVFGVGASFWDRAEMSERDESGNQTILLWHPSGFPFLRLKIESYSPAIDAAQRDFAIADLLDVFTARERARATLGDDT